LESIYQKFPTTKTPIENYPGVKKFIIPGGVYVVHLNNSECFYLRTLLHMNGLSTSQGWAYHFLTFSKPSRASLKGIQKIHSNQSNHFGGFW
jgi:hypothetical protein